MEQQNNNKRQFWWLNANPKLWPIDSFRQGEVQTYTSHNDFGNKRQVYRNFTKIKAGDWMIGYESTPVKQVKAIFEVVEGLHLDKSNREVFNFRLIDRVKDPISWEVLKQNSDLKDCRIFFNNQGSLFELQSDEFDIIQALIDEQKEMELHELILPYEKTEALKDLFLSESEFDDIIDTLKYKKNIILQGPPGVGKTFIAKRLAYSLMGVKDDSRVKMVQFHQSYSYEDFIQGLRPDGDGDFKLKNGIFYEFCRTAQRHPMQAFFFIIDEINRGNLSKIFGELMSLIESDKRGSVNEMPLTYSGDEREHEPFFVPENIYLIGTMNTADRSLAMVDYALRRRFAFISLAPNFSDKFKAYLLQKGIDEQFLTTIIQAINELNQVILQDKNLQKGFQIGHSYFSNIPEDTIDWQKWYNRIVNLEIAPLLQEYWFDNEAKAEREIEKLRYEGRYEV